MGMAFNTAGLNTGGFNTGQTLPELTIAENKPWFLQVRTPAGVFLHRLTGWYDAVWEERINQPGKFSVTLPLDEDAVQSGDIDAPNELWLFDVTSTLRRMFRIVVPKIRITDSAQEFTLEAEDVLANLRNETPDSLGIDTSSTAEEIIDAILDSQTTTGAPIEKGVVDGALADLVPNMESKKNVNLLKWLQTLEETIGGYYFVDNARRLNWRKISTDGARDIYQLPDNLAGYEMSYDRGKLFNSVRVLGGPGGSGVNKQTVKSDTVTDATSIATYGLEHKDVTNPYIRSKAQADLAASEFLDKHKNGLRTFTCPTVNTEKLAVDTLQDVDRVLVIGKPVRLKPPANDPINTGLIDTIIYGFKWNLDQPLQADLEFSQPRDDFIRKLVRRLRSHDDNVEDERDEMDDLYQELLSWIGGEGEFVEGNAAGDGMRPLTLGAAGQVPAVKSALDGHEYVDAGTIDSFATKNDLDNEGVPSAKPKLAEVTSDGQKTGLWRFPATGSTVSDWVHVTPVVVEVTDLANVDHSVTQARIVFVPDGNTKFGVWLKPENSSVESDIVPANAVIAFDSAS